MCLNIPVLDTQCPMGALLFQRRPLAWCPMKAHPTARELMVQKLFPEPVYTLAISHAGSFPAASGE
jgi:hypothetical protein